MLKVNSHRALILASLTPLPLPSALYIHGSHRLPLPNAVILLQLTASSLFSLHIFIHGAPGDPLGHAVIGNLKAEVGNS